MSSQSISVGRFLIRRINIQNVTRNFSRKSNNNNVGSPYKVVKARQAAREENSLVVKDPNFELLAASHGFPFFLPGNVGLAWYDTQTTIHIKNEFLMEKVEEKGDLRGDIMCRVQTCPTVLRQSVCDLFPYRNLENSELSVITISLKLDTKLMRKNKEVETERMAQTFVITAKNVCDKLRKAGYWADFINPFSGRPYLFPTVGNELYEADEKFRCLDFQIFEIQDCKIVSNEQEGANKRFIGSLFTNAPSKKNHLNSIFNHIQTNNLSSK